MFSPFRLFLLFLLFLLSSGLSGLSLIAPGSPTPQSLEVPTQPMATQRFCSPGDSTLLFPWRLNASVAPRPPSYRTSHIPRHYDQGMGAPQEYIVEFQRADGTPDSIRAVFRRVPDPVMLGALLERNGEDLSKVFRVRAKLATDTSADASTPPAASASSGSSGSPGSSGSSSGKTHAHHSQDSQKPPSAADHASHSSDTSKPQHPAMLPREPIFGEGTHGTRTLIIICAVLVIFTLASLATMLITVG